MEAVKNDPRVIRYVPNSVRVPGFILAAVKQNADAIWFLNEDEYTPEVCYYASMSALLNEGELYSAEILKRAKEYERVMVAYNDVIL